MKRVLFDSTILVAGALEAHADFQEADALLSAARRRAVEGYVSQHAFAETFGKLTGLPLHPRISPKIALAVIQHYEAFLTTVELIGEDYREVFVEAVKRNATGAAIYDLLHIQAAKKVSAHRIDTLNVKHFSRLSEGTGLAVSTR